MTASSATVDQNPLKPGVGDVDPVADKESDAGGVLIPLRETLSLHQSVAAATAVASTAPEARKCTSRNSQGFLLDVICPSP